MGDGDSIAREALCNEIVRLNQEIENLRIEDWGMRLLIIEAKEAIARGHYDHAIKVLSTQ